VVRTLANNNWANFFLHDKLVFRASALREESETTAFMRNLVTTNGITRGC